MGDKKVGRNFYDHVDSPKAPSTWEYIVKADHLKQVSFAQFDKNGKYLFTANVRFCIAFWTVKFILRST